MKRLRILPHARVEHAQKPFVCGKAAKIRNEVRLLLLLLFLSNGEIRASVAHVKGASAQTDRTIWSSFCRRFRLFKFVPVPLITHRTTEKHKSVDCVLNMQMEAFRPDCERAAVYQHLMGLIWEPGTDSSSRIRPPDNHLHVHFIPPFFFLFDFFFGPLCFLRLCVSRRFSPMSFLVLYPRPAFFPLVLYSFRLPIHLIEVKINPAYS